MGAGDQRDQLPGGRDPDQTSATVYLSTRRTPSCPRPGSPFPVYVRGPRLAPGPYVAQVAIRYGNGHRLRRTFRFTISAHQLRQVYGTTGTSATTTQAGSSASSIPVWGLVLGAVLIIGASVGESSLDFRRRAAGT